MKRILITLDFPPEVGGVQRYLRDRVAHTYTGEDEVIAGCVPPAPRTSLIGTTPVRYVSWLPARWNKKWSLVLLAVELFRARRRSDEPVVECGNVYAGCAAYFVWLLTRKPYRVYTYGTELLGLRKASLRSLLLTAVLARAERLYALGDYTQTLIARAGIQTIAEPVPPRIELPRDTAAWRPCATTRGDFAILCVARLVAHKGHTVLLDAVNRLPPTIPWNLTLVGDGPEREALMGLCRSFGIQQRVTFLQHADDAELHRLYRSASVLVLPSIETSAGTEGFGIVLLEAMAFSLPVIASRVGGIPEVLGNGACGILVEPGDGAALAASLTGLFDDPSRSDRMTRVAHQRLLDAYRWPPGVA